MTYISILDYSRGTTCIIEDEEDTTKRMQNEELENLLYTLGFKGSEISYMVTDSKPSFSSTTLKELQDNA